jgi:hypothetical protein
LSTYRHNLTSPQAFERSKVFLLDKEKDQKYTAAKKIPFGGQKIIFFNDFLSAFLTHFFR